jgi:23S rRNA pseudouridine1911/1915/1917 synthase
MNEPYERRAVVDAAHEGSRVDRFVAETVVEFSRSQFEQRGMTIEVNGEPARASHTIHEGDRVRVTFADAPQANVAPEEIPLDIIYEDDAVVVINKPQGMVVHPAAGNWSGTLVQGLLHHVDTLADDSQDPLRPGIVHRLDKDTSGVLITAKNPQALEELARQFEARTVVKNYLAIVRGVPPASTGRVEANIGRDPHNRKRFTVVTRGGKPAATEYRVLRRFDSHAYLSVHPVTGRTHQIRVHLQHLGCPVVGDPLYARRDRMLADATLMLHASLLTVRLPGSGELRTFEAPLPERFTRALRVLEGLP